MLRIPLVFNNATRVLSTDEKWAGTTIDDRQTMFIVSGIPEETKEARLDVKVAVKSVKGHSVHPFMRLNVSQGTGTCTVPLDLFRACKRDLKFIVQLVLTPEEGGVYASANMLTFKVSAAIASIDTQGDVTTIDRLFKEAEGSAETQTIIFTRVNEDLDIVDVKPLVIKDSEADYNHAYSSQKVLDLIEEFAPSFAGRFGTHAELINARKREDGTSIDRNDWALVINDEPIHTGQSWLYRCIDATMLGMEGAWQAEFEFVSGENVIPLGYHVEKTVGEPKEVTIKSDTETVLPKWKVECKDKTKWLRFGDGDGNAVKANDGSTEMILNADSLIFQKNLRTGETVLDLDGLTVSKEGKTLSLDEDSITRNGEKFDFVQKENEEGKIVLKREWVENGRLIRIEDRNGLPGIKISTDASKVVAKETKEDGAPKAKSLEIDGAKWNLGGGEGGSSVEPSEVPIEGGKQLAALTIDDEAWNVGGALKIQLDRTSEAGRFYGEIEHKNLLRVLDGTPVIWTFGDTDEAMTSELSVKDGYVHIIADTVELGDKFRFYGSIESTAEEEKHAVNFVKTEFSVNPITQKPEGAPVIRGLRINGSDYALTEGSGGGSVVIPHAGRFSDGNQADSMEVDGVKWNLATEIIPSDSVKPQAKRLLAMDINGEAWAIDTKVTVVSLSKGEEENTWVGNLSDEKFKKITTGQFASWNFSGHPTVKSAVSTKITRDENGLWHSDFTLKGADGKEYAFNGTIEDEEEHAVRFVYSEYGTEALKEAPEGASVAKGLVINGEKFLLAGGTGGDAAWGSITGNIADQSDLQAVFKRMDDDIEDAQDDADSAKSKASDAEAVAGTAMGMVAVTDAALTELEYKVRYTIDPQISALEASVGAVEGRISGISEEVDALNESLARTVDKVNEHTNQIQSINSNLTDIKNFIDEIRTRYVFVNGAGPGPGPVRRND